MRAVIEHTPDVAIQWYALDGRILFCNRASERLFGWKPGEAIGKTLLELGFFDPGEEDRFAASRLAATRGEKVRPTEFTYRRPDGTTGFLLSTVFQIPFTETESCYVCMDVELTEHRRVEEAMRASETLRAHIYSLVEDGIFYLAIEEGEQGRRRYRFLSVNPAFLEATGLTEDAIVGRCVDEVIPEPSRSTVVEKYEEAIRSKRRVTWEEVTRYPSGVKHGEVTVSPVISPEGQPTHLVGTIHDVTSRRGAEEARRQLEWELQQGQRLQSLGTLVSGIAHDFNNVLAGVQANTTLALDQLEAADAEGCRERLFALQRASQQATDLVRRILTFSRQDEPRRERLDLRKTVDDVLEIVKVSLPPNIMLERTFESDDPSLPLVMADPLQLQQVVMNLVTNAVYSLRERERSGASGTIEVGLRRCTFTTEDDAARCSADLQVGSYVCLTVRDDGCGMDDATMKRAFDPFFTTKPSGEGTGLGLSTVHGIVKAHEGAVTLTSRLGVGTTFALYFRAAPPAPGALITTTRSGSTVPPSVAPASAPSERTKRGGLRILYVDDEEALVFLAKRVLGRLGHSVTGCTDPITALHTFRAQPGAFDVVVTDLAMPGLPGAELAEAIRAIRDDLPIIMLTGFVRNEDYAIAERIGIPARHIVPKPLDINELARTLIPLLPSSQAAQPEMAVSL